MKLEEVVCDDNAAEYTLGAPSEISKANSGIAGDDVDAGMLDYGEEASLRTYLVITEQRHISRTCDLSSEFRQYECACVEIARECVP